jgi:hypothetical protein
LRTYNDSDKKKRKVDLYRLINTRLSSYDKDFVIKTARTYLVIGSIKGTAKEMGCAVETVRNWMNKDWWPILLEELKYIKNIELDGHYTGIMEKSLREVVERLENGDEVVVNGEIRRKKVSARDAALISAIMFDKRQLLRGDPTSIRQQNFNVDERMEKLMSTFEQIARKENEKVIPGDVERDVATINNVISLPPKKVPNNVQ